MTETRHIPGIDEIIKEVAQLEQQQAEKLNMVSERVKAGSNPAELAIPLISQFFADCTIDSCPCGRPHFALELDLPEPGTVVFRNEFPLKGTVITQPGCPITEATLLVLPGLVTQVPRHTRDLLAAGTIRTGGGLFGPVQETGLLFSGVNRVFVIVRIACLIMPCIVGTCVTDLEFAKIGRPPID